MGWKTPKIEYVNGYKIIEVDGPAFKVYEGDLQLGDDFPYSGEAAAHANSLPKMGSPQERPITNHTETMLSDLSTTGLLRAKTRK